MMYTAKVSGNFTETQSVEADSIESATEKFMSNEGETLNRTDAVDLSVTDVNEVEDEEVLDDVVV